MTEKCHHFNTAKKSSNAELMTNPSFLQFHKALNNNIQKEYNTKVHI